MSAQPVTLDRPLASLLGYAPAWLAGLPESAIESFAGTGNPFSVRLLSPGAHVVDVGSGASMDSLISGRMVGATGCNVQCGRTT
jgi:hypothetical protein